MYVSVKVGWLCDTLIAMAEVDRHVGKYVKQDFKRKGLFSKGDHKPKDTNDYLFEMLEHHPFDDLWGIFAARELFGDEKFVDISGSVVIRINDFYNKDEN